MFILKSLYISIFVALRMVPIILVAGFSLVFVISFFLSEPLALIMILGVVYLPLTMFLYLAALRAGLMSLRATEPPLIKKLWQGTIRLMRFQLMLTNMVVMLLGVGVSVVILVTQFPETWDVIRNELGAKTILDKDFMLALAAQIPLGLIAVFAFAMSVAIGLIGVSAAATGAFAAVRGPNHDMLWGVTEKFFPLFGFAFLILVLPALGLIVALGGPMAGLDHLIALPVTSLVAIPLYLAWAACALCAAKALAYVRTVTDTEARFQASQDAMLGEFVEEDDLRAMRIARQKQTEI